jgi:hypothetical protein
VNSGCWALPREIRIQGMWGWKSWGYPISSSILDWDFPL